MGRERSGRRRDDLLHDTSTIVLIMGCPGFGLRFDSYSAFVGETTVVFESIHFTKSESRQYSW